LIRAFTQMKFSARANDKILRTARTIADLAGSDLIDTPHISEAIQYRRMDSFGQ
ncbi:MAG: ATP-binding protein, partial [Clostridia bacterium]|nr:ATP-binding protein [Clostridia bacterium]